MYVNDARAGVPCRRNCLGCKPFNGRAANCEMYLVAHVHSDAADVSPHVMLQALRDVVGPAELLLDYAQAYWAEHDRRARKRKRKQAPCDLDDVEDRRRKLVHFIMEHDECSQCFPNSSSDILNGHTLQIPTLSIAPRLTPGMHEYVRSLEIYYSVVDDALMQELIDKMPHLRNLICWNLHVHGARYAADARSASWLSKLSIETETYEVASLAKLPLLRSLRATDHIALDAFVLDDAHVHTYDESEKVDLLDLPEALHAAMAYVAAGARPQSQECSIRGDCEDLRETDTARAIGVLAVLKNEAAKHAMSVFMMTLECEKGLPMSGMNSCDMRRVLPSVIGVSVRSA